jgi:hypothetical protein
MISCCNFPITASSLALTRFVYTVYITYLALSANFKVEIVSSILRIHGETVAII